MTALFKRFIILSLSLTLLCACTPSEKEAVQDTQNAMTTRFKKQPEKINAKAAHFTYFKPKTLKVSQKGDHNIIFKDPDGNVYILFVNPKENTKSELNYKIVLKEKHKGDLLKSFYVGDHFIFVYVKPLKNKDFELVVDAGGVKMSAKATLNHLNDKAKMMAQVVRSVKVKKG